MSLSSVLKSLSDRFDKILALSPDVATLLSKYPEILEKEPTLQEFVKTVNLRSPSIQSLPLIDKILTLSIDVAILLSKYPGTLEKEPTLQEFTKTANPRSLSIQSLSLRARSNNDGSGENRKPGKRKTKTQNQAE